MISYLEVRRYKDINAVQRKQLERTRLMGVTDKVLAVLQNDTAATFNGDIISQGL